MVEAKIKIKTYFKITGDFAPGDVTVLLKFNRISSEKKAMRANRLAAKPINFPCGVAAR